MTLNEKLQSSMILAKKTVSYKQLHISTKNRRLLSVFSVLLLTLYTIYTKLILKNTAVFDWLVFFTLLNIASSITIKVICNSTFALNHYKMYSLIFFISKLCKVAIFGFSLIDYVQYFKETENEEFYLQFLKDLQGLNFKALLDYSTHELSFVFSLVLFIPTAIYFLILCVKTYISLVKIAIVSVIPIVNIIYYLAWLFKQNPYFLFYHVDEEKPALIIIEKRKIYQEQMESNVGLKFLVSLPLVIAVCISYYYGIEFIKKQI